MGLREGEGPARAQAVVDGPDLALIHGINLGQLSARIQIHHQQMALLLAGGFIEWIFWAIREAAIQTGLGHVQISRQGFRDTGIADPQKFLLPGGGTDLRVVRDTPHVEAVGERLMLSGLVSSGETTLGFTGVFVWNACFFPALERVLSNARRLDRPVVVHVKTRKGRGYRLAEDNPTRFHGIAPFSIVDGMVEESAHLSYSEVFADVLARIAREDPRVVGVTAAMAEGTGLAKMRREFPARVFDVGIAEEHAVTFAAGLALSGLRPVVAVYSTFLQRAVDQVVHDVAIPGRPVVFAVDRAGLTVITALGALSVFGLAFFGARAGTVIWAMYALGIVVAMIAGMVFTRTILKPDATSAFVLELPPYRQPALKSVLIHMWENTREFVRKAGTTILFASVVMWLLLNLPVLRPARLTGQQRGNLARLFLVPGVVIACILPWTIRNAIVYGDFLLLNSNTGYAMYSAQHPMHGASFREYNAAPLPEGLGDLNEAQLDKELMARGIGFILDDPAMNFRQL